MPNVIDEIYMVGMKKGDKREIQDYTDKTLTSVMDLIERRRVKTQEALDGNTRSACQLRDYLADNGQPLTKWIHKGRRVV